MLTVLDKWKFDLMVLQGEMCHASSPVVLYCEQSDAMC